jgi:broad specificity phosphatase PhoE
LCALISITLAGARLFHCRARDVDAGSEDAWEFIVPLLYRRGSERERLAISLAADVTSYSIHMSSGGELWLIRHGETEWTLSGAHTSRTDLPLTPAGEQRAALLKEALEGKQFALILSSPMQRATETARLAGFTPQIDQDLCEWDYGQYEGRTTPEIQRDAPGWSIWTTTPPGGESAGQVQARAARVIARAESAGGDVALFGHGHMLRVLAATWLEMEAARGRSFALSTGTVSVLGYERDTRVIKLWNRGTALNEQ